MLSSIPRCTVIIFKKRRLVGWKIIGQKRKDAGIQLGNTLVVGGKAIKDVDTHYFAMFQMVVFDIFTMIISWLSLAYFCKINLFQAFCNMMNKYWKIFLVTTPSITLFFGLKDVNFGMDFSGSFIWITDEGRRYLIRKAVNLSEEETLLLLSNTTLM